MEVRGETGRVTGPIPHTKGAFVELKVWNLATRTCLVTVPAHQGFVRGIALGHGHQSVITAGDDKTIKLWPLTLDALRHGPSENVQPVTTFLGEHAFSGVSHKAKQPVFATSGPVILLWDETRGSPTTTFEWGCDRFPLIPSPIP